MHPMKAMVHAVILSLSCVAASGHDPGHDDLEDLRPGVAFFDRDPTRQGLFVTGPLFERSPLILTQAEATNGAPFCIVNQCGKGVLLEEPKFFGFYQYDRDPPPEFQPRAGTNRMTAGGGWSYPTRSWEPYHNRFELLRGDPKGPNGEYSTCGCGTKFSTLPLPAHAAPTMVHGELRLRLDYIVMGETFRRSAVVTNRVAIQIVPDSPAAPGRKNDR